MDSAWRVSTAAKEHEISHDNVAALNRSFCFVQVAVQLHTVICTITCGHVTSAGGFGDHIMMAKCYSDGFCDDVQPVVLPLEYSAEDPRVVYWQGWFYLFYYASGQGLNTVYLRRTQTPQDVSSWQKLGMLYAHTAI
jgi:hypothetical protein